MSDIKSMISNMANGKGSTDGESPVEPTKQAKPAKPASKTIEKTYQKKTQLEHILLRPDTYIGSVEKVKETMWIYDTEKDQMIQKEVEYVPGLYKIFDEILVNAADNKQRDKNMDCIKIEIKKEENIISVWNNGLGIPVSIHKDENMYVPTMIFGHLLTSSNYDDDEAKVTGGRNGYGAKLCNIFSTKFTVETASKQYKKSFKQTWACNMSKASEPKIKPDNEDYTKITFSPDLTKFKMDKLDDDIVGLMYRRAYDICASTKGVKVFLNGKRLPVKNFKDYIDLYIKGNEDEMGNPLKIVHEECNERWEVAITISDKGFQQVSFVNSIATTKGGRHVEYVTDMIVKQLLDVLKKKNKGGVNIKPFQVKNHLWVFVNCLIVNPTFDSQTKETMTLQAKNFGSKCTLSDKFINMVTKCGIVEVVLSWAKYKAQNELAKQSGKKQTKLKGIPKLEDANEAGSKANSLKCTLILTEGDSAKSTVVSGLGVVGRDYYGIFPLRGKILNVREATHKQILENQEINNIIKIVGLQYKKKYNTIEDMKTLRYGKIMIMTDQDQDGSHIKGLFINFIHHNWPELLKQNFIEQFITPIVKARKKNECLSFFSIPEYHEWKENTPNHHTYHIKYYKGLGTSDAREGREYFANLDRHRVKFKYDGQQDDDNIMLAFSKKMVDHRKEWLTNFMVESRRRKEIGLPEKYLYKKDTVSVTYSEFINLEFILFSNTDNQRSIPSMVDGLKPGQRKIMFVAFKRNDKREVKVSQLVGSVIEKAAYHHGDTSLAGTIVGLAQTFVGSNNINLLEPRGQFGTRLTGGKDAASPRYIFTKLSPLTRLIFHPHDDPLLKHEYDDNIRIEPQWYCPIIPMILVNGADGIGTGWMTKIPNYNPRDLVKNIRIMLDGGEPEDMKPWYRDFKGSIEVIGDGRYVCSGEMAILSDTKLEITELPVGTWTTAYKENVLEPMVHGTEKIKSVLTDYKDYSTDITVKYTVSLPSTNMQTMEKEGGLHKSFKLQSLINTSSMCAFDEYGCLKRYDNVKTIIRDHYELRIKLYQQRKDYIEGMLSHEAKKLSAQARFILEKCNGELVVENKKRKVIIDELIKRGYPSDPVAEWKAKVATESGEEENEEGAEEGDNETERETSTKQKSAVDVDIKKYDYLLGMSMWMLTDERKNELLKQKEAKETELKILQQKTPSDLWREDLDIFIENLEKYEKHEREQMKAEKEQLKKNKKQGKKKVDLDETLPTADAIRVEPAISEELKKKVENLNRIKQNNANKRLKKENIAEMDEAEDEFDVMAKNKKTLKDKLGTPEEVVKKASKKGKKGDGMKQTKLNFNKANGSPNKRGRKKKASSDSESGNSSDIEFVSSASCPVKERTTARRVAAKPKTYDFSNSDSDSENEKLFDNEHVLEKSTNKEVLVTSEDEDEKKPVPPLESSEDMFDNLVGRKKDEVQQEKSIENTSSKRKNSFSDSDSEFGTIKSKAATNYSSDEDEIVAKKSKPKSKSKEDKPKKPKQKKQKTNDSNEKKKPKPRKKHAASSDDEDFVIEDDDVADSKRAKVNSDDDGEEVVRKPTGRRKAATKKYFDESDASDDLF